MSWQTPPPPGWYPDPDDPTGRTGRWFDGSAWTEHRAPGAPGQPPAPPSSSSGRTPAFVIGALLTALFVLGGAVAIATSTRTSPSTSTAASGRRFPADPLAVDVCSLLTREELRAVAREDLGEPDRHEPLPGEPDPSKRCRYQSEDRIEVTLNRYHITDTEAEFRAFYAPGQPDATGEPTRYPVEPIDSLPTGSSRDPQDFLNLEVSVLVPGGWNLDVHVARHDLPPNGALVPELRRLVALALDRYAPR